MDDVVETAESADALVAFIVNSLFAWIRWIGHARSLPLSDATRLRKDAIVIAWMRVLSTVDYFVGPIVECNGAVLEAARRDDQTLLTLFRSLLHHNHGTAEVMGYLQGGHRHRLTEDDITPFLRSAYNGISFVMTKCPVAIVSWLLPVLQRDYRSLPAFLVQEGFHNPDTAVWRFMHETYGDTELNKAFYMMSFAERALPTPVLDYALPFLTDETRALLLPS